MTDIRSLLFVTALALHLGAAPTTTAAPVATGERGPAQAGFETMPIVMGVSDVLPAELAKGASYTVDPAVFVDGFDLNYTLRTQHGIFDVDSTALLRIRIDELNALQRMLALERTEVFGNALKTAGKAPIEFAKGLMTEPVDTVSNTITGVGRFFKDLGRSIVSDDPNQENALKTAVGFAAAKRKFAYEFGVNPYSSFEPLQERLNQIAWAATGGGLTVKAAFTQIDGSAGTAVRVTGTSQGMRQLVRDSAPAELLKINTAKLLAMGASEAEAGALTGNNHFDPQERTLLVGALDQLSGVANRRVFVRLASRARDASEALYWRLQAEMMEAYHFRVAPLAQLVKLGEQPFLQARDGSLVGVFPVDFLAWTERLSQSVARVTREAERMAAGEGRKLWLMNTVTPAARAGLEAAGWKVTDQAGKRLAM